MTQTDMTRWVADEFGVVLRTLHSRVGLDITDLVGLALRRNPRRAHLLVSTVLGKHLPVDPGVVIGTGRLLGELVARALSEEVDDRNSSDADHLTDAAQAAVRRGRPLPLVSRLDEIVAKRAPSAAVVLGFAETATGLGHLVADQLRAACYLHSTRRMVPTVDVAVTFQEGHSHATDHLLLPVPTTLLDTDSPLILVDDELSTGSTAMNTITQAHRRHRRRHYVLATLIDLRSDTDEAEMRSLAAHLDCRIDVIPLVRGSVVLPDGLIDAVTNRLSLVDGSPAAEVGRAPTSMKRTPSSVPVPPAVHRTDITWSADVPDGGRHGFLRSDHARFERELARTASVVATAVKRRLAGNGGDVLVIGTEELMYLPVRLAERLGDDLTLRVGFQSTTRSPVLAIDDPTYPVRRQFRFADPEGDPHQSRFLYNCYARSTRTEADLIVVVVDAAADTAHLHGPDGLPAQLVRAGLAVELIVLAAVDTARLAKARTVPQILPNPLRGPAFGSYSPDEVAWLLTDLSDRDLEVDVTEREAAIQAGTAHYAESLPIEFQPDAQYQQLFHTVLAESAQRLALAVGLVTELVLHERGHDIVLASLARAGTPIGILLRRWAAFRHDRTLPHYALSIVRGRGIDRTALRYIARHHESQDVVFVDGWTGKGAIARELSAALAEVNADTGCRFSDDLAVLADPGYCVRTFGTRDDFLIASACLNSTVSGLVSRTVRNDAYLRPDQFDGAKFYHELVANDVSAVLLDAVSDAFPTVVERVLDELPRLAASDREPTFAGWAAIEAIRAEYGIESINFVKPGVGETTRVLLRRVPWRILLREADNPDHDHLRMLALQRRVPLEIRPDLPYSCVGLIRRVAASEPDDA